MLLSTIICTRNRADEIVNCLPVVALQARQFGDVEVVVVDNGSTDNTRAIVLELTERLEFPFKYVYEPVAGLCQARNRGRAEASGRVLAYIDDDEEIGPDWIRQIREHFLSEKSDCLAGKIGVRLEAEPPFPVDDEMLWFFCTTALGDKERYLEYPEHANGGNMSFRTEVFDAVGGFDTNLKLYGDETEFFRRVSEMEFGTYYNPKIEVNQIIPKDRLTKEELRHKSIVRGKGAAAVWLLGPGLGTTRLPKIVEFFLRTGYVGVRQLSGRTFGRFFTFWFNWGYLVQLTKGPNVRGGS